MYKDKKMKTKMKMMMKEGMPSKQAVAIALDMAKKRKSKAH
jgi:hypothetical protein